jgi:hypothetical protein
VWSISQFCDRFSVDKHILSITSTNPVVFSSISNNPQTFAWSSIDNNITTALFGTQVWTYNAQQNSFVKQFDTSITIAAPNKIINLPGIVVIAAIANNSAQVLAYSVNSAGNPTNCLNYSNKNFVGTPKLQFS